MLQFNEFSAWVEIDGIEAKEYGIEVGIEAATGINTVSCWIASSAGKTFSVNRKDLMTTTATKGDVSVDGIYGSSPISYQGQPGKTSASKGFRDSADSLRPYMFSQIETTDDDAYLNVVPPANVNTGQIEMTVTRVATVGQPHYDAGASHFQVPTQQKFHERSKKALAHQVSAGQAQYSRTSFISVRQLGPPIVKFIFRYRSLDMLMANGIAPLIKRKAEAEPDPADDDDSDIEILEDVKPENLPRKKAKKELKPEIRVKNEDVKPVIRDLTKKKRPILPTDDVIDLT